jgi:hypothetical protein
MRKNTQLIYALMVLHNFIRFHDSTNHFAECATFLEEQRSALRRLHRLRCRAAKIDNEDVDLAIDPIMPEMSTVREVIAYNMWRDYVAELTRRGIPVHENDEDLL